MRQLTKVRAGPGFVQLTRHEPAAPPAGCVRLRVLATGVCGTDLHIEDGDYPVRAPVTMGHEIVGEVEALGAGTVPDWLGSRVASETFFSTCGECSLCLAGRPNLCSRRRSIGTHVDGGFAPTVIVPQRNLHELPGHISPAAATLLEPLACVCHALLDPPLICAGDRVLVTGPGPMGLLAAQVARLQGGLVMVCGLESDGPRLQVARGMQLRTMSGAPPDGDYDITIESSGSAAALAACLTHCRRGGRHVQLGIFGRDVTADVDAVLFKELIVTSGFASVPQSWQRAATLVASRDVVLDPLISQVVPLANWRHAFDAIRAGAGLKFVLDPR
jgi:L-iditol 2-dehydrogenase